MRKATRSSQGVSKSNVKKAVAGSPPRAAKADGEVEAAGAIAAMSGTDRVIGERIHAIVKSCAPALTAKLWYGMPAYALDGRVVCFFQSAQKFKTRYATLGFLHEAKLDAGAMWPTAYALTGITSAEEVRIAELVRRAVGKKG